MKKHYLPIAILAFFCLTVFSPSNAQSPCDDPVVLLDDNLDSYTDGALGPQADHWTTWSGNEGGDEDALISGDFASSGLQSMVIMGEPGGGPQDVLLLLGDKTEGMFVLEWQMYIIGGLAGYHNIQHFGQMPGEEYSHEVFFGTDGMASLNAGSAGVKSVPYPTDEWFRVRYLIDLDNDLVYLWVGREFVHSWPFSWQADAMSGTKMLGAVDFYPIDENHWFYIDDIYYAQVPPAEAGKYCHMATPIEAGTHTVGTLDCFGAGFTVLDDGSGLAGAWYSYTPTEDGLISLSSCGNGQDSRVWIFSGGCENLDIEGVNDDLCSIAASGSEWASYREVLVSGGETYLILWDNIWASGGFDFTLDFSPDPPAEGDFCETAIEVQPGTHTIDQVNGHAAVAGPNINHTAASTTNYAQSEWYAFIPETNGTITVTSCGLTSEDTRLWIYTGDCGIENLNLVANSDDDENCGVQSLVMDLEVTGGTTYYIEWDSETKDAPGFDWELSFEPVSAVTSEGFNAAVSLSPNPASDVAFVNYGFYEKTDLNIRIFNDFGQLINTKNIKGALSGHERIDLSALNSGLYLVMLTDEKNTVAKRLVVE